MLTAIYAPMLEKVVLGPLALDAFLETALGFCIGRWLYSLYNSAKQN